MFTTTIPEEIIGAGRFNVTLTDASLAGSAKHFLRIAAYPDLVLDPAVDFFGFWDIPLSWFHQADLCLELDKKELIIPEGPPEKTRRLPLSIRGPAEEDGEAVWHISLWATDSEPPRMLFLKSHHLFWVMYRSLDEMLRQPGYLDRAAVPSVLKNPSLLSDTARQLALEGDCLGALSLFINLSRIVPDAFLRAEYRSVLREQKDLAMRTPGTPARLWEIFHMLVSGREPLPPDDTEAFLRSLPRSDDPNLAFIAETLLIDLMLAANRDKECFDEFFPTRPSKCVYPYSDLLLVPTVSVEPPKTWSARVCCHYSLRKEFHYAGTTDIESLWNTPETALARRDVQSDAGEMPPAGCRICPVGSVRAKEFSFFEPGHGLNAQQKNHRGLVRHFLRRDLVVATYPDEYVVHLGNRCNLRCLMCHARFTQYSEALDISFDYLLPFLEGLAYARELTFTGGEPLLYEDVFRKIIGYVAARPEIREQLAMHVTSNGTLLHKAMEWLAPVKKLGMRISLDSMGPAYEKIRKGAEWRTTERNILDFVEHARSRGLNWALGTSNVIMKSSLAVLPDFARWHCAHGVKAAFFKLESYDGHPETTAEDLLRHPEYLAEIPGWRHALRESAAIFKEHAGQEDAVNDINLYAGQLHDAVRARGLENAV